MKKSFGEKLRNIRKEKRLTQQKMASLLNMTQGAYCKYENNQTSPNPETLIKISKILDISLDYLLNNNLNLKNISYSNIMERKNRIKELRTKFHITQKKLAKTLATSQSNISSWESGRTEPNQDIYIKLCDIFHCSLDYITGRSNENIYSSDIEAGKSIGIKVPVLGSIPAGIPIEAIEEILDYEEIPKEWASQGEYFGLKVKGNSMEPRICSGDVVIVRKQEDAETGDVCVVMVNGFDATLKQIKKDTGGITLVPFNKSYSPVYYSNKEIQELPVRIVGKVVELRGKF